MDFTNFFWAIFGAVLSTFLGYLVQRWEKGKKRLIYFQRGNILTLKNLWSKKLSESDFSHNDPLIVHINKENIKKINKTLSDQKEPHGFKFSNNGRLRFQYWEPYEILTLFLNDSSEVVLSGTIIEGQLLSYDTVKKEYRKKYRIARTIMMSIFYAVAFLLVLNLNLDEKTAGYLMILLPSISVFSFLLCVFYKSALKRLIA